MDWMVWFSLKPQSVFGKSTRDPSRSDNLCVLHFPPNSKAKGGHLVVFRGTRMLNTEGEVCCCDDPLAQRAIVDKVELNRFWSSFSGCALILKRTKASQGLRSIIVDKL